MDKRSLLGLLIIGGILFAFSFFNANEVAEDIETANNQSSDSTETFQEADSNPAVDTLAIIEDKDPMLNLIPKVNEEGKQFTDSFGAPIFIDTLSGLETAIADFTVPQISEPKNNAPEEIVSIV